MNRIVLVLLGAFVSLHVAPAIGAVDAFKRETKQLSPHVHLVYRPIATNAPYEGNSIVIEQSDGLVVVDAGGSPVSGRHIAEAIKAFSTKPVKFLVYTHYHGDHNLGAGELLARWPRLTIVATEQTRANMLGKPMDYIKTYDTDYAGAIEFSRKQMDDPSLPEAVRRGRAQYVEAGPSLVAGYHNLRAFPPAVTFSERLSIPDRDEPVEIAYLGNANTDGDAVVWIPHERILCTGDIVVSPIPYAAASYPTSWLSVLEKIGRFDFAQLVPGHGDVQTDRRYLDRLTLALRNVRTRVGELAKEGKSLDEIYKEAHFNEVVADFAGDDVWLRNLLDSFFLHSLIKNAYFEATNQPIVQGTS
jgi:glyoxylase-like metal-dependent hydrolase (beta-lactamase superfamily II)